jgi:hypothetical protein
MRVVPPLGGSERSKAGDADVLPPVAPSAVDKQEPAAVPACPAGSSQGVGVVPLPAFFLAAAASSSIRLFTLFTFFNRTSASFKCSGRGVATLSGQETDESITQQAMPSELFISEVNHRRVSLKRKEEDLGGVIERDLGARDHRELWHHHSLYENLLKHNLHLFRYQH